MSRTMRMPSEKALPPGSVRDFVELLFRLYRMAHRPALRTISEAIRRSDHLKGTASTETIRRMLRGTTVPANWSTVEAVYLTLCELAGWDSSTVVEFYGRQASVQSHIEKAWHEALDSPDERYDLDIPNEPHEQPATFSPTPADDPWADEPPF